ncbi:hypothetical protein HMPREF9005_0026, partial [Actinomyces sp. oral taxon 178 str. F0338]
MLEDRGALRRVRGGRRGEGDADGARRPRHSPQDRGRHAGPAGR